MGADYVTQSFTANPVNAPNTRPVPRIPAYDFMAIASGRLMRKSRARMLFQKNIVRWKTWTPQTADTARRLRQAQEAVAECDRRLNR